VFDPTLHECTGQAVSGVLGTAELFDLRSARALADQVRNTLLNVRHAKGINRVNLSIFLQVGKKESILNGDILLEFANER
jgi:hypothetical protein